MVIIFDTRLSFVICTFLEAAGKTNILKFGVVSTEWLTSARLLWVSTATWHSLTFSSSQDHDKKCLKCDRDYTLIQEQNRTEETEYMFVKWPCAYLASDHRGVSLECYRDKDWILIWASEIRCIWGTRFGQCLHPIRTTSGLLPWTLMGLEEACFSAIHYNLFQLPGVEMKMFLLP